MSPSSPSTITRPRGITSCAPCPTPLAGSM